MKQRYFLGIKSLGGVYSKEVKEMTEKQFEAHYDAIVAKGGKIITILTEDI